MSELSEEELFGVLKKYFNFDKFKSDIQRNAIESVLQGNEQSNKKIFSNLVEILRKFL